MKNRFCPLLLLCGLALTGCADHPTDVPTPSEPPVSWVPVEVSMTKTGTSARALFVVSRRPMRASASDYLVSYTTAKQSATATVSPQEVKFNLVRAEVAKDTVYLCLYYQRIQAPEFVAPRAGESVQVQVRIAHRAPITLRVDATTFQQPANAWMEGIWQNSGVELTVGI